MMTSIPLLTALWAAVVVTALGVLVLRRTMPLVVALGAMLFKTGLAVTFALTGDVARWSLIDDVRYYWQGRELLALGHDPFSDLFNQEIMLRLVSLSEGFHVLYGWFNYLAQWLVGPYYFAPVILNVLLTAIAARLLWALLREVGAPDGECTATAVAFLLYWDVLAWSSFVNVKDNLVLALTIGLVLAYVRLGRGVAWGRVVAILVLSLLFLTLRFYVPMVALLAFLASSANARGFVTRHRWSAVAMLLALGAGILALLGQQLLAYAVSFLQFSPVALAQGVVRILLTPQPWSIDPNYEYLLLPSVLHITLLVPALLGFWALWRHYPAARFLVIYYAATMLLFAAFPRQQGPRYRYQVVFMMVWSLVHLARVALPAALRVRPAAGAASLT